MKSGLKLHYPIKNVQRKFVENSHFWTSNIKLFVMFSPGAIRTQGEIIIILTKLSQFTTRQFYKHLQIECEKCKIVILLPTNM